MAQRRHPKAKPTFITTLSATCLANLAPSGLNMYVRWTIRPPRHFLRAFARIPSEGISMFSFSLRTSAAFAFILCTVLACLPPATKAQTIRVDMRAENAIAFDPDKAMGTSLDILTTKEFAAVFSEPIVKAGLSAGWGPITYRQNTELTYDAWHWNPNGIWSDEKQRSGYFVGSAEPSGVLRESYGYRLPHRGTTRSDSGQ